MKTTWSLPLHLRLSLTVTFITWRAIGLSRFVRASFSLCSLFVHSVARCVFPGFLLASIAFSRRSFGVQLVKRHTPTQCDFTGTNVPHRSHSINSWCNPFPKNRPYVKDPVPLCPVLPEGEEANQGRYDPLHLDCAQPKGRQEGRQ